MTHWKAVLFVEVFTSVRTSGQKAFTFVCVRCRSFQWLSSLLCSFLSVCGRSLKREFDFKTFFISSSTSYMKFTFTRWRELKWYFIFIFRFHFSFLKSSKKPSCVGGDSQNFNTNTRVEFFLSSMLGRCDEDFYKTGFFCLLGPHRILCIWNFTRIWGKNNCWMRWEIFEFWILAWIFFNRILNLLNYFKSITIFFKFELILFMFLDFVIYSKIFEIFQQTS